MTPLRANGRLEIIIPVYNEGEHVRATYENLANSLEGRLDWMAYFVYDYAADPTVSHLQAIQQEDSRVVPVLQTYGKGVINALKFGFSLVGDGPVAVVMGDNSDDLSRLPSMCKLVEEGAAVAAASRFSAGGSYEGGEWLKKNLSRIAGQLLYWVGIGTKDPTNNFKVYSGKFLKSIKLESVAGFELALEITAKAAVYGERVTEVPGKWTDRVAGESNFKLVKWLPHYLKWFSFAFASLFFPPIVEDEGRPATFRKSPHDLSYLKWLKHNPWAAVALIPFSLNLLFIWLYASPVYFWDEWDAWLGFTDKLSIEGWSIGAFWEPHNEHRIPLSKFVFATLDLLNWGPRAAMAISSVLLLASYLVFVRYYFSIPSQPSRLIKFILFLTPFFFFSFVQKENLFWGFQVHWFIWLLGALVAISAAVNRRYILMSVALAVTYLSLSAWVAVWSAVFLVLLVDWLQTTDVVKRRQQKKLALLFLVGFIGTLSFYLRGLPVGTPTDGVSSIELISDSALFLVSLFGSPFQMIGRDFAFVLGAIAIGWFIFSLGRRRFFSAPEFFLLVFALLYGVLIAWGRVQMWSPGDFIPSRYITAMIPIDLVYIGVLIRSNLSNKKLLQSIAGVLLALQVLNSAVKGFTNETSDQISRTRAGNCVRNMALGYDHLAASKCWSHIYPEQSVVEKAQRFGVDRALGKAGD